jgi:alpha-glucosidase (family GH31 glycosyl hydrolase)
MVVAFNNQTYFPAGKWKNFWTGEVIKGQQLKEMEYPKYRGGGLYVRSGGIIPLGKIMQYRGEKLKDTITLYVFPEEIESSVEFYEDDGISFEFEKQKYAITSISTKRNNGVSMVKIGKSNGDFEGMLENRTWNIILHLETKPVYVIYNKKNIPENNYTWDETRKEITVNGVGEGIIEVTELLNK